MDGSETAKRHAHPSGRFDQFNLRLPDGMRDQIKVNAALNRRSMNAEVIYCLERVLGNGATMSGPASGSE